MKSPQHTFRRRKSHELHPSYHNGTRENRDLSGARDVQPVHCETDRATFLDRLAGDQTEPRLRIGTCPETLREGEDQLRAKLDDTMRRTIVGKLRATWSPEQIVGRLCAGKITFSTIYRCIHSGRIDVPMTVLR
nr:hypothetical protein [Exiguobacterium sp. s129]